jgi:hypothetical protein
MSFDSVFSREEPTMKNWSTVFAIRVALLLAVLFLAMWLYVSVRAEGTKPQAQLFMPIVSVTTVTTAAEWRYGVAILEEWENTIKVYTLTVDATKAERCHSLQWTDDYGNPNGKWYDVPDGARGHWRDYPSNPAYWGPQHYFFDPSYVHGIYGRDNPFAYRAQCEPK